MQDPYVAVRILLSFCPKFPNPALERLTRLKNLDLKRPLQIARTKR